MLVMTRAAGESVRIGDDLLTVIRVRPSVRLRFVEQGRARNYGFAGGTYKADASMAMGLCRVVLMAVGNREVTLGFDAPRTVRILRSELTADYTASEPPLDESDAR
jgi:sRNA-binding carbon storage regulator CsrA